ncbi:uncharacterized protein LOC110457685 isoform X2 [Mizuhopecten yessoensis]|uniref:Ankyrin repeat, PH and SEC7 domain containing protein secG n=2 Tax=Mizuhopecten yessoensis TaxID=6573 RepID=A0A210R3R8_MIZYE|nr:uncharacterized protein LOC110457685 isoform X2 [Mizuhopecten yessoensis]OWF55612.1 Ankyrin repeat, PH and SEC7 domain containing protein secG [Mizuhopecten yessoensis]
MIGITKARIEEEMKNIFIVTKGFQDAKEKLQKTGVVVIKGNTGDGKTTIAMQLLHWLMEEQPSRQPLQLHDITDFDLAPPKTQLITFVDNMFGEKDVYDRDVAEWNKRIKSVLPALCGNKQKQANFLVKSIRNEVFNSLKRDSLENVFVGSNTVDISSKDYKVEKEKMELLDLYKPLHGDFSWRDNEKKAIVLCEPGIGFPQCCKLFRDFPELQKDRVKFFEKPYYFLNGVLSKLGECSALLFLFLNGGKIRSKDLDPNGDKVNKTLLEESFAIGSMHVGDSKIASTDFNQKIGYVQKSLDSFSGFLVAKDTCRLSGDFVYSFYHYSVQETVSLLYQHTTPIGFIQNCPRTCLYNLTTSKTSSHRMVLLPDHYSYMYDRVLREFDSTDPRDYSIDYLRVWTNDQFMKGFMSWLDDKSLDKLDVVNKACSAHATKCALYLMSKGIIPDNFATFWSLIEKYSYCEGGFVGDVDVLKEIFPYLNDEMKLPLFNEACDCSDECVLYLLSKGVQPGKGTDLPSLFESYPYRQDDHDNNFSVFQAVVGYVNDEVKVELLDYAFDFYSPGYVFYLLRQGVKPSKFTSLWSFIEEDNDSCYYDEWERWDMLVNIYFMVDDDIKSNLWKQACSYGPMDPVLKLLKQNLGTCIDIDAFWSGLQGVNQEEILMEVVVNLDDQMKLELLHKACSTQTEECVLECLLADDVKCDENTPFCVVKRKCMNVLKNIVNDLTDDIKLFLLNVACYIGYEECVSYLLSGDVECKENAPFCVVKRGSVNVLRSINKDLRDSIKPVLLNLACYTGSEECVLFLLSESVEPETITPFYSVKGGNVNVLRKLLEYDITLSTRAYKSNNSSYHVCNINVLHEACLLEKEEMVAVLCDTCNILAHGTDELKRSSLQHVAMTGNFQIFQIVERSVMKSLSRDENKHMCESVNGRVVHKMCVCAKYMERLVDVCGWTVLHESCVRENKELCLYLCQSYPALTAVVDKDGRHCLHYLAEWMSVETFTDCETQVKQYLESTGRRYDITTILDNNGRTVLHEACMSGHMELCLHFCQSYPELTAVVDKYGGHCLHYIAMSRTSNVEMFNECETHEKQYLESTGRKHDITTILDKQGKTVLDKAKYQEGVNNHLYDHLLDEFLSCI